MEKLVKKGFQIKNGQGEILKYNDYKDKLGTRLKDYLNASEMNRFFFLSMSVLAQTAFLSEQIERGNITKTEHTNLKTSVTYLDKFISEYMGRLSQKQIEELTKRGSKGMEIKIMDYHTLSRLDKKYRNMIEEGMTLPREELYDLIDLVLAYNCNQCDKCHMDCRLYDILRNNFIPEMDPDNKECPYKFDIVNGFTEAKGVYIDMSRTIMGEQVTELKEENSKVIANNEEMVAKLEEMNMTLNKRDDRIKELEKELAIMQSNLELEFKEL